MSRDRDQLLREGWWLRRSSPPSCLAAVVDYVRAADGEAAVTEPFGCTDDHAGVAVGADDTGVLFGPVGVDPAERPRADCSAALADELAASQQVAVCCSNNTADEGSALGVVLSLPDHTAVGAELGRPRVEIILVGVPAICPASEDHAVVVGRRNVGDPLGSTRFIDVGNRRSPLGVAVGSQPHRRDPALAVAIVAVDRAAGLDRRNQAPVGESFALREGSRLFLFDQPIPADLALVVNANGPQVRGVVLGVVFERVG